MTNNLKIIIGLAVVFYVSATGGAVLDTVGLGLAAAIVWGAVVGWVGYKATRHWVDRP